MQAGPRPRRRCAPKRSQGTGLGHGVRRGRARSARSGRSRAFPPESGPGRADPLPPGKACQPRPPRLPATVPPGPCARGLGTWGMRAAGVPGRGRVGEDVEIGQSRTSSTSRQGCRRNIASLSVGKAGDDDRRRRRCPDAPGTLRRAQSRATASARRWRRFMRFRIRSLPAWSERCRWGMSRGSSAQQGDQISASSSSTGSTEESLRRGRSGT